MQKLVAASLAIIAHFFMVSPVSAACPGEYNSDDITVSTNDTCTIPAGYTYILDKATDEASTTNPVVLQLTGGSLTIANTAILRTGSLTPNGGSIIIQDGGTIIVGGTTTAYWVDDADADGYAASFTTYTATAAGRRRLGLMKSRTKTDCNDQSLQVWLSHSQCYKDTDGDTYTAGLAPNTTCLNTSSCNTATRASASTHGAAVAIYTAGRLLNSASGTSDCYDANANAKPGQTVGYSVHRGDGSYDYNCSGTQTYYGTAYYGYATGCMYQAFARQGCPCQISGTYISPPLYGTQVSCGQYGATLGQYFERETNACGLWQRYYVGTYGNQKCL